MKNPLMTLLGAAAMAALLAACAAPAPEAPVLPEPVRSRAERGTGRGGIRARGRPPPRTPRSSRRAGSCQ